MELADEHVKIAASTLSKGARVIKVLTKKELVSRDDDAVSEEIARVFDDLRMSQALVRLNIPRHLTTVRFLKLPSTDENEITRIVRIEALKHIPYSDEDVIAGHRIIEKFEDGYSSVLVAIAQAERIQRLIDILKKARVDVETASLGSETLFVWYLANFPGEKADIVLLVNIDCAYVDIDVVDGEKLVFTRGVSYSAGNPLPKEKIADQIKISMAAYHKESNKAIKRIILTGARARVEEARELIEQEVKTPVEMSVGLKETPVADAAQVLDSDDSSFVELLGLVMKKEDMSVNLMPEAAGEERRLAAVRKNFILTVALAFFIVALVFGLVIKRMGNEAFYLSRVNAELKAIGPKVAKVKKMMKEIAVIKDALNKKPLAVEIMSEIHKITPDNVSLTVIDFERHKTLMVRGSASALADVFNYVNVLEKSRYFDGVKVKYANKRLAAGKELADFEITCYLSGIQ